MTRFNFATPPPQDSLHIKRPVVYYWQRTPFIFAIKNGTLVIIALLLSSCAVYYLDRDSGAEHIWGFGHLSMKAAAPAKEKQALIQRATLTGIAIGLDNGSFGLSVGWNQREHILIYDENAAISIQRHPTNDFFYFKIGTYPPDSGSILDTNHSNAIKENHP